MDERKNKSTKPSLILLIVAIVAIIAVTALQRQVGRSSVTLPWTTDLPKALERARAGSKVVLLDFTGSDWCPACRLLEKNVLNTREFADFSDRKLELVMVDLPQTKSQPDDLKAANQKLVEQFKVNGFPTLVALDVDNKEIFRMEGYDGSSPEEFINMLDHAITPLKKN